MKILTILFILIAILQIKSNKLEVVVASEMQNILYIGVDNPVTALIEKASKNEVILTTNNGKIEKHDDNRFVIHPSKVGVTIINVCKLVKKDTVVVGQNEFRTKYLPDPTAHIGEKKSGISKKSYLMAQGGVRSYIEGGFDAPVQIIEYALCVINNDGQIGVSRNVGARFTDSSVRLLNQLMANDHLIIHDLSCRMPDGRIIYLSPMEFIIEE